MVAILPTTGRATWVDRVDNWRVLDTDWLQDRLVLRYATGPSTLGEGGVYYDTTEKCLMVRNSTSSAVANHACIAAAVNFRIYPGATDSGVTLGHKTAAGLGLVINSAGALTVKPSIATVNNTVFIDATGITIHTTPAITAKLTTDATGLHSSATIVAPLVIADFQALASTNAKALTATTGSFTSNVSVTGTTALTGNTTLSTADVNTLSFGARLGQHINMYTTQFGLGIQGNTLYFRTYNQFKFYVGGSHTDVATASVVTIDSNSLDLVGNFTASGTAAVNNVIYSGTRIHAGGNGGQVRLIDTSAGGYDVFMEFYGGGTGVTTTNPGNRAGYVGYPSTTELTLFQGVVSGAIRLVTQASVVGGVVQLDGGPIILQPANGGELILMGGNNGGEIQFSPGAVYMGKMQPLNSAQGATFMWGKAAIDIYNAGIEMIGTGIGEGQIKSTTSTHANLYLQHAGAVNANGKAFIQFLKGQSTATIGLISEITQLVNTAGTSIGVHFSNFESDAVSDYRMKDDLGPITGALDRVMQLQPKRFVWKGTTLCLRGSSPTKQPRSCPTSSGVRRTPSMRAARWSPRASTTSG